MYALVYPIKGFRVRIGINQKDVYGPYRTTWALALADFTRVRAQNDNAAIKRVLYELKAEAAGSRRRPGRPRTQL